MRVSFLLNFGSNNSAFVLLSCDVLRSRTIDSHISVKRHSIYQVEFGSLSPNIVDIVNGVFFYVFVCDHAAFFLTRWDNLVSDFMVRRFEFLSVACLYYAVRLLMELIALMNLFVYWRRFSQIYLYYSKLSSTLGGKRQRKWHWKMALENFRVPDKLTKSMVSISIVKYMKNSKKFHWEQQQLIYL